MFTFCSSGRSLIITSQGQAEMQLYCTLAIVHCVVVCCVAGSSLIKVGQTEQKLGQAHKEFEHVVCNNFLQPLKGFLDGDMKTVQVIPFSAPDVLSPFHPLLLGTQRQWRMRNLSTFYIHDHTGNRCVFRLPMATAMVAQKATRIFYKISGLRLSILLR
jgi:hypothetical protein